MNKTEYFVAAKICGFYELLIADNQKGANHSLFRKAPELIEQNIPRFCSTAEWRSPLLLYLVLYPLSSRPNGRILIAFFSFHIVARFCAGRPGAVPHGNVLSFFEPCGIL